jgi:DNA-binding transcriptional ArsR family regulator
MQAPHPAQDTMIELISQRLRLLGQPLRIKLLETLSDGPLPVYKLTAAVGGGQQNVSQHLTLLHQAGIISRQKDGRQVIYTLTDPHVQRLLAEAHASLQLQLGQLAQLVRSTHPT